MMIILNYILDLIISMQLRHFIDMCIVIMALVLNGIYTIKMY